MASARGRGLYVLAASGLVVLVMAAPTVIVMRLTAGTRGGAGKPPTPAQTSQAITLPAKQASRVTSTPAPADSPALPTSLPTLLPAIRSQTP